MSHKNKLAKHLSGGLKRRLNFAIGLINHPKVIFLDEITVGIDPQSRQFILDSVAALKQQGVTVIYTSHYLQEIEQLCDKLVLLNEGNLIYQGTVQGILEEGQSLERFYLAFLNRQKKYVNCIDYQRNAPIKPRSAWRCRIIYYADFVYVNYVGGLE